MQFMKHLLFFLALLLAFPLFSQKQTLHFEWPKRSADAFLLAVFGLGDKGIAFCEQVKGRHTLVSYLSADGKTSWRSDKIDQLFFKNAQAFWDEDGFTIYARPQTSYKDNKKVFFRLNYAGKIIDQGERKFDLDVITHVQSAGKLYFILEAEKKGITTLYLQETDRGSLKPLGAPKPIDLPAKKNEQNIRRLMGKVKVDIAHYWAFAGSDDKYLLFFGKNVDLAAGKVNYLFVKTDHAGKKVAEFTIDMLLEDGKFINRTVNEKNINSVNEHYIVEIDHSTEHLDPGTFGECRVNWQQQAIYFFGCFGNEADYSETEVTGYYIQKYDLSGKRLWAWQRKNDMQREESKIEPAGWPMYLIPDTETGRVVCNNFPMRNFSVDSTGSNMQSYPIQRFVKEKPDLGERIKARFSMGTSLIQTYSGVFFLRPAEIAKPELLQDLFGTRAGGQLQAHLEKNGHVESIYLIQKNNTAFNILQMDQEKEQNTVWTVSY